MTARRQKDRRRRARRDPDTLQREFGCPYPHSETAEAALRAIIAADPYVTEMTAAEYRFHCGILKWVKRRPPSLAQLETVEDIARRRAGYRPKKRAAA